MSQAIPTTLALNRLLRYLLAWSLAASLVYYIWFSHGWPVVWDSAVMHYVNFLIDHGFRPYRDISDSNMPGAYLIERWAVALFGAGDLGWRVFDFFLSAVLAWAFILIAKPVDWLAGFYAAAFFALLHGSEGPDFAVEREQEMTVLLAVGLATLFLSMRRRSPPIALFFGLCCGLAISIKPTAGPFALAVGLAAAFVLRRRREPLLAYVAYAVGGLLLAALPIAAFFLRTHSFLDFLHITRTLLPAYVVARQASAATLLRILFPRNLVPLFLLGIVLALLNRRWDFERWILFAAALFGAVSYFSQRKGIIYHRYPFVAFSLLLLGLEFLPALASRSRLRRLLAVVAIAFSLGVSLPHYLTEMRRTYGLSAVAYTRSLTDDLQLLGPARLERQVECFDLTDGCFSALLHLHLVQHDGYTGDLLFFSPTPGPVVDGYRHRFWNDLQANPPEVVVLSNEWFQAGHTFRKLQTWPAFQNYLSSNYIDVISRAFPDPSQTTFPTGDDQPSRYRIYIRRGSPLLTHPPFPPEPANRTDPAFSDRAVATTPPNPR